MRIAVMVLAAVAVGAWLVSRIGGRVDERLHDRLAAGSAIVMRLCVGAALAILALRAAIRGGSGWIEFAAFMLGALWFVAMGGLLIWGVATGKRESADPA